MYIMCVYVFIYIYYLYKNVNKYIYIYYTYIVKLTQLWRNHPNAATSTWGPSILVALQHSFEALVMGFGVATSDFIIL